MIGSRKTIHHQSNAEQGAPEVKGLWAAHGTASACLQPRLPVPAHSPSATAPASIPFSDDSRSQQWPVRPLPSVAVRWDLLASATAKAEAAGAAEGKEAEAAAKLLETRLGVLLHVIHGGNFRAEHFEELMQMLRCKWDRSVEEEEGEGNETQA